MTGSPSRHNVIFDMPVPSAAAHITFSFMLIYRLFVLLSLSFPVIPATGTDITVVARQSNTEVLPQKRNCTQLRANDFDRKKIFLCYDTNTTLLHHSMLDTASNSGESFVPSDHNFQLQKLGIEPQENTWIEALQDGFYVNVEPMVPLSGCLDNKYGSGGSLGGEYSVTMGATANLDLPFLWEWGFQPSMVGGVTNKIGSIYTISRQFLCMVPANATGQVFYRPFRIELGNPTIRQWSVFKGIRSKIATGKWIKLKSASFYTAVTPPQFLCVTDPDELRC